MRCAGCRRELEVGDQYIQFTQSEWAERQGLPPLDGMDDLFAQFMGSGHGDQIVYCEDCTEKTDDGWLLDTVYGDEELREHLGTNATAAESARSDPENPGVASKEGGTR